MSHPAPWRIWNPQTLTMTITEAHPYHARLAPPSMNPTLPDGPGWYGLADDPHCPLCRAQTGDRA